MKARTHRHRWIPLPTGLYYQCSCTLVGRKIPKTGLIRPFSPTTIRRYQRSQEIQSATEADELKQRKREAAQLHHSGEHG